MMRSRAARSMHCRLLALPLLLLAARLQADVFETVGADGGLIYSNFPKTYQSIRIVRANEAAQRPRARSSVIPLVQQLAREHGLDASLMLALIAVESHFNPRALSHAGAMGLMQLMPQTAAQYGVRDPYDPYQSLDAGMRYFKDLLQQHDGNVVLALSAYNCGPNAVAQYGARVPPYPETMLFVAAILARAQQNNP